MSVRSPYPGLRPFQPDESRFFFGREQQIDDMLTRLENHRFLAVVGTSGCGKSSLVKAGLLPAIEQGLLSADGEHWQIAVMRPENAPFDGLASALLEIKEIAETRGNDERAAALLQATLRRGSLGLVDAVAESHLPAGSNLLLVVDQFEEIFRYREQAENVNEAHAFINLLLNAVQHGQSETPIYVVLTMRSDFIGDCALFNGLPEAINDSQFLTPRLSRTQYRDAIVKPARLLDGNLEPELVNRLLNDLRGEPDQLPILQHALMRMWTRAASDNNWNKELTLEDYQAVGGLSGALSAHANEAMGELNAGQQRIAEIMFRRLAERGSDQRDTRHPASLGEVAAVAEVDDEEVKAVVEAFRRSDRSFLMPPPTTPLTASTMLDISHESLIRQWRDDENTNRKGLNSWIEHEAEISRLYQRLSDAAQRYQQGVGELWRGLDLEQALNWEKNEKPNNAWAKRYGSSYDQAREFLRLSQAESEARQKAEEDVRDRELRQARALADERERSTSRLKLIIMIIGIALFIAAGIMFYAFQQRQIAQENADIAQKNAKDAKQNEQRALNAVKQAEDAAAEAEQQRQIAESGLARFFAAEAERLDAKTFPQQKLLLATEGAYLTQTTRTDRALRQALTKVSGELLIAHQGSVNSVAFSADERYLVSGSSDNSVRLWDLNDPKSEARVLSGHQGDALSVAFSGDSHYLASGSSDYRVRLWDLNDLENEPRTLGGHQGDVLSVAFSGDGRYLASGGSDNSIRLWNLHDLASQAKVLSGHQGDVLSVAFSGDGRYLVSGSSDDSIRLWDLNDLEGDAEVLSGQQVDVLSVAVSADSRYLASGSSDNRVRLWDLNDLESEPNVLYSHQGPVNSVAFSVDGRYLASGSSDDSIRLWDLNNLEGTPKVLSGQREDVLSVAFSAGGRYLASGSDDNSIWLWDLNDLGGEPREFRGHQRSVNSVALSKNGRYLASGSSDQSVRLWDLHDLESESQVLSDDQGSVSSVAFSVDGQYLALGSRDSSIRLWNLDDLQAEPRKLIGHQGYVWSVTFSADGRYLASGSADKSLRLWDLNDLDSEPGVLRGQQGYVWSVAFSMDGRYLASGSSDKNVRLWGLDDPEGEPTVLSEHEGFVNSVAFSADGRYLASGSYDQSVRLWDLNDLDVEAKVLSHRQGYVSSVAFSADGRYLASGSSDNSVRLWYLDDLDAEPRELNGHLSSVNSVTFSADGRYLASGSSDNSVRLWRTDLDEMADIACRRARRNLTLPEWRDYWGERAYRRTCPQWSIPESLIADAAALIGTRALIDEPLNRLVSALQYKGAEESELRSEAQWILARYLIRQALDQAQSEPLEASKKLNDALQYVPFIGLERFPFGAREWDELCWSGGLQNLANEVMPACETAVKLAPHNGRILDSRGLNRALSGDLEGAIKDFEVYIEWGLKNNESAKAVEQRRQWVEALRGGRNPIDEKTLEQLRN